MNLFKLLALIIIAMFLASCGTIREGFTSQKKNNSDEFLVEKKSPLVMPPDYNELPEPKLEDTNKKINENEIKSLITKNKNYEIKDKKIENNKNFEESILKKIKKSNAN